MPVGHSKIFLAEFAIVPWCRLTSRLPSLFCVVCFMRDGNVFRGRFLWLGQVMTVNQSMMELVQSFNRDSISVFVQRLSCLLSVPSN